MGAEVPQALCPAFPLKLVVDVECRSIKMALRCADSGVGERGGRQPGMRIGEAQGCPRRISDRAFVFEPVKLLINGGASHQDVRTRRGAHNLFRWTRTNQCQGAPYQSG